MSLLRLDSAQTNLHQIASVDAVLLLANHAASEAAQTWAEEGYAKAAVAQVKDEAGRDLKEANG